MKKEEKEIAIIDDCPFDVSDIDVGQFGGDWGAGLAVEASDIIIPRIQLVQAMTTKKREWGATEGDYRDSLDGKLLGNDKAPVEIIIFDAFKNYLIKKSGGESEFVRMEQYQGLDLPWEFEEDGLILRRIKQYNFYCLRTSEDKNFDITEEIPYLLTLSSTSSNCAKSILTSLGKLKRLGKPSAATTFLLSSKEEVNDKKQSYFVSTARVGRPSLGKEVLAAHGWYLDLQKGKIKVDDETGN